MQTPPSITLEVCVDSLTSAKIAADHGAQRVELNTALELGGLTPSIGLVEQTIAALTKTGCVIIAMVRPRPGGFAYTADELATMQRDIKHLLRTGLAGVALGVLTAEGAIDEQANQTLIEPVLSAGKEAVFHRAFDLTPDSIQAIETLISLGFKRVLTSGQAPTAPQGSAVIRQLIHHAAGRIEVLPGSGITPDNADQLIRETGCTQVHASLRRTIAYPSCSRNPVIQFNSPPPANGVFNQADPDKVAAMMDALHVNR